MATRTTRTFEPTEEQYEEMQAESGGYCLACGQEAYGVEQDAENYDC